MKLTEHLLALDKDLFKRATQHSFLTEVGTLQVKPKHLASWLVQDRYYTGGYIKMMGLMIARLPLYEDQRELGDSDPHYSPAKAQNVIRVLTFALSNIHRENQFFTDIVSRQPYRAQEERQKAWTARYVDYLRKVALESGHDLGEALVVLWAMEVAFLNAWNFAKSLRPVEQQTEHAQTCQELMTNWTTEEFNVFVKDCEDLVNQLDTSNARRLASFERVYREILALEVEFWDMAYK